MKEVIKQILTKIKNVIEWSNRAINAYLQLGYLSWNDQNWEIPSEEESNTGLQMYRHGLYSEPIEVVERKGRSNTNNTIFRIGSFYDVMAFFVGLQDLAAFRFWVD